MISTSPKKEKEARQSLGADHFVVSKDEAQMSVRLLPDHSHAWHWGGRPEALTEHAGHAHCGELYYL